MERSAIRERCRRRIDLPRITLRSIRATKQLPLPIKPERSLHDLHATAADMDGSDRTILLADARQQEARPAHVDALPDLQSQFAVLHIVEIGKQRRAGRRRAARRGIFGQSAGAGMKHPRLQLARLFALWYVAGIEVDGVAAVTREGFCERRGIRPGPPQRLAGGDFDGQKRQPDRDDLRWMTVGLDVASRQREAAGRLFDGKM